jgi:hypothetical protein
MESMDALVSHAMCWCVHVCRGPVDGSCLGGQLGPTGQLHCMVAGHQPMAALLVSGDGGRGQSFKSNLK